MGIIRLDASRSSEPKDWVNAPAVSLQPSSRIASAISSLVAAHWPPGHVRGNRSASLIARSRATQHISFE